MLTYQNDRVIIDVFKNINVPAILFLVLFIIFCPLYSLWNFIDNNQKITVSCIKNHNKCTIETKKLLFGSHSQKFIFNKMGSAFLHNVGCSKGNCYYNVQIPYKNSSVIKLYSSSENTKVQKWLIENFNKYKNDKNINAFKLNTEKQPVFISGLDLYMIIFIFLFLIIILFSVNIKIVIYADKKNNFLIIENKHIIGKYKKEIPLSRIKDIELVELNKYCIIQYRLLSGIDYEICRIVSPEEARKACNTIKEFILE